MVRGTYDVEYKWQIFKFIHMNLDSVEWVKIPVLYNVLERIHQKDLKNIF